MTGVSFTWKCCAGITIISLILCLPYIILYLSSNNEKYRPVSTEGKNINDDGTKNFFWPYPLLLHRSENWNVSIVLLKGLYLTISRQHIVATFPYTKAVVATCMRLILREQDEESEAMNMFNTSPPPSSAFCEIAIKLAARLMYCLKDKYSLKDLCGGTVEIGNEDRTLRVLVHLLLPLCIRLGTGNKREPRASKEDISYAVSCLLNIIVTPLATVSSSARRLSNAIAVDKVIDNSPPSFVQRVLPRKSDTSVFSATIHNAAYLGLKIIIICFPDFLSSEWPIIAAVVKEAVLANSGHDSLWDFLDFIVLRRTPLFLLILPIIWTKLPHLYCQTARGKTLKEKVVNNLSKPPHPTPSKESWMKKFTQELAVCTGTGQNDMFMCRNPIQPSNNFVVGGSSDVESMSDFGEAAMQPVDAFGDVFEQHDKQSPASIARESPSTMEQKNNQATALKKRVSFDNSASHDNVDTSFDELRSADRPFTGKHKRSLPRQEFAVDIESPITFRRPSLDLPQSPTSNETSLDDEEVLDSSRDSASLSKGKKRRLGKNRKPVHQTSIYDSPEPEADTEYLMGLNDFAGDKPNTADINVSSEATVSLMNPIKSTLVEIKVFTEGEDQKVNSIEMSEATDYSQSSSEDGPRLHLIPRQTSPDGENGLRNVLDKANVAPWARSKLEKSKETCL